MEMDNTTTEILKKIELNLGVGKNEIIFNQSELDENPAKKSTIDWLKDIGVFTDSYTITDSDMDEVNLGALDVPPPPKRGRLTYDPDPQSTLKSYWEAQKEYAKELGQRKKHLKKELGKVNWKIIYFIDKDKFRKTFNQKNNTDNIFYFIGKELRLKTSDKGIINFNLSPTYRRGTNPYYLTYALIELLRTKGNIDGKWYRVDLKRSEIADIVRNEFKIIVDDNWFKNTKGNLVKIVPKNWKEYWSLSIYDRTKKCYEFKLKMPD